MQFGFGLGVGCAQGRAGRGQLSGVGFAAPAAAARQGGLWQGAELLFPIPEGMFPCKHHPECANEQQEPARLL